MRLMSLRHLSWILVAVLAGVVGAADWPMPGGNPQRNGWAASERQITKANVSTLKLLYKYQTDNQSRGTSALTSPIISGNLITYRGFKEMLMFAGSSDKVYSIDADLNQPIWQANLPFAAASGARKPPAESCPNGLTSPVVMAGSSSNSLHFATLASRAPAANGVRPPRPSPYLPPLAQSIYPLLPTTLTQLNAIYTVTGDGFLHILNSSTGQDLIPSIRFVPPESKVTSLNLRDNVVYATTADGCDGYRNALFAMDILNPQKTVWSFVLPQGGFAGSVGTSIGNDGTVYVQAAYPRGNDTRASYETVVALTPRELKVKDYFTIGDKPLKPDQLITGITPVVFSFTGRDLVIAGGSDGKVYLLDSRSLGGVDHHTPLFATAALAERNKKGQAAGFRGVFSTWLNVDTGTRRFYASVFGPVKKLPGMGGDLSARRGMDEASVIALELKGTPEQPTLEPVWVSGSVASPVSMVIADDMVFVLSDSQTPVTANSRRRHAVPNALPLATSGSLHVLDATSGKDLPLSTAAAGAEPSGGLALANGRLYFPGRDNAVYCFGIPAQQGQLITQ